jgi:hypothetical protein
MMQCTLEWKDEKVFLELCYAISYLSISPKAMDGYWVEQIAPVRMQEVVSTVQSNMLNHLAIRTMRRSN